MKRTHYSIALVVLAVSAQVALADPLGTAFTYQGRLADGGQPANGSYDLRFILYDAEIGGSQQGNVLTNSAVAVSGGLFTTALDFGATVFGGDARWLEIAVRQHGTGGFVPLDPRQPLTPTPYALFASNTATIGGQSPAAFAPASGSSAYVARTGDTMTGALNLPGNGLTVGGYQLTASGGHVRIGAASLTTPLSVGADAAGGINVGNVPAGGTIFSASDGDPASTVLAVSRQAGNIIQFEPYSSGGGFAFSGGNVGIGTIKPLSRLQVIPSGPFDGISIGDVESVGATSLGLGVSSLLNGYADIQAARGASVGWGDIILNRQGGNVGIGTNSPAAKLDVNGAVRATGPINAAGGFILELRTDDPPSPATGQMWLRTDF